MKILGGQFKNKNFYMPGHIRPTQNVVRKALFDILGQDMGGKTFVDMFAGSGAVGLEAVSRGAEMTVFIEHDPTCTEVIEENFSLLGLQPDAEGGGPCELIHGDAFASIKSLMWQKRRFDIVFCDPPYGLELAKKALKTLGACDIVHPASWVIIEHERREMLPQQQGRFTLFKKNQYGSAWLSFYRLEDGSGMENCEDPESSVRHLHS